ncbi:MerR family transcriptional regulator [Caulobacter sp. CCNWLY153]|uniref:MerR family transcriptional regulator n=1 Tax=unclassified Caulobacter TaxID=2648921 RepID=UPI002FF0F2F2
MVAVAIGDAHLPGRYQSSELIQAIYLACIFAMVLGMCMALAEPELQMIKPSSGLTPVSVLAARLGVTSRNLRYYEELGLVRAERISTKALGYDDQNVDRLTLIIALRAVGVPTATIRAALAAGRDATARRAVARTALMDALLSKRTLLDTVERVLSGEASLVSKMLPDQRARLEASIAASPCALRDPLP